MTKRSSFVMPPVLACVAAIVDILDRSPKSLLQSSPPCAEPGQMGPRGCVHGNIAVKPHPIRLLARRAEPSACAAHAGVPDHLRAFALLRRTKRMRINRYSAWRYCALA